VGSRFWPVSTPARPKQLLPLASDRPLIVDTVERARALAGDERIRILAPPTLGARLAEALPSFPPENLWSEPTPRGTAPALAWAAWRIRRADPEAVMVSLHADHVLEPIEKLTELLRGAAAVARDQRRLLTVGAAPDRPEVGFGYIDPGAPIDGPPGVQAYDVRVFHEKPDASTAVRYLSEGYLWNTGIFVWRADAFLEEVERHAPQLARLLPLLESGDEDAFFRSAPNSSVDVAVLERSDRVGVVRADFRWDDVGSWEALARTRTLDADGNALQGDVHVVDASGNVVFTDDTPVVLFGVDDLVVVRTERVTLVASRARAPDLKDLLERLPEHLRRLED